MLQWPVEELNSLREKEVNLRNKKLKKGDYVEVKGITAAQVIILIIEFNLGVLLSKKTKLSFVTQADVEISFSFSSLEKAEAFDSRWVNAENLCAEKGSKNEGGIGPFGILTLASEKLEEFTPVFFRIFKASNKHVILMCSDATR